MKKAQRRGRRKNEFHVSTDEQRRWGHDDYHQPVEATRDMPETRVVVIIGAGERTFVGGADINALASLDVFKAEQFIRALHEALRAIREHPAPVIAAVNGYALGAGLELMMSCDIAIATVAALEFGVFGFLYSTYAMASFQATPENPIRPRITEYLKKFCWALAFVLVILAMLAAVTSYNAEVGFPTWVIVMCFVVLTGFSVVLAYKME